VNQMNRKYRVISNTKYTHFYPIGTVVKILSVGYEDNCVDVVDIYDEIFQTLVVDDLEEIFVVDDKKKDSSERIADLNSFKSVGKAS